MTEFDERKSEASEWFSHLREQIVIAFMLMEEAAETHATFESRETKRAPGDGEDGGGGQMSMLRGGNIFEKAGVNVSTVHGTLSPEAQAAMAERGVPGIEDDPRFWASGISLVAHMQNPHCPAVHMNTRMFWTPGAAWFGGGTDLNPAIEYDEDTEQFHSVLKECCDCHGPDYYERFKAWADEYFHIPHRNRARGVGGIFFDDLDSGDWDADFAFVQDVGRAFLAAFLPLVEKRAGQPWTDEEREAQLVHRGLYAEYNLVYDRGTKFGLATGHDPDAVLMSLPPLAKWN